MREPQISIIIVSYNVRELLLACLKSLFEEKELRLEVIVVDNCSSDDSITAIQKGYPTVKCIENKENKGFSEANNQGMRIAQGKYLFLLNPDTEVHPGALERLFRFLENGAPYSIVGPQLLNSDGSLQISAWKDQSAKHLWKETLFLHLLHNDLPYSEQALKQSFELESLSGAALFFHRNLFEKIGGLDPHLFWMEDIDFCFRARKVAPAFYLHDAQVTHHSGQSSRQDYRIPISNQLLSKLKFFRKNKSNFALISGVLACFVFIHSRILMFLLLAPFRKVWRLKLKAYLYTWKRFFRYLLFNDQRVT
ncbi:MAG: glycosyltransferase family 2 protein [Bacteroidetes bacterium]|nr:MAG: glycosyltransferase family 2 protein [Bacteroidota bacterium]